MKNFTYSDVMSMPTAERRFYIGLELKKNERVQEQAENKPVTTQTSKGTRQTKVSGKAIDSRMRKGDLPI